MESMRSLSSSLPRASRRRASRDMPPEDLLTAFKSAALSVTNLYKTAGTDRARARAAGYQDALDDLLTFLDRKDIGLGDGEGWQVRQWATERLDGTAAPKSESDMEDDEPAEEEKMRSSSPEQNHKPSPAEERKTSPTSVTPQPPLSETAHPTSQPQTSGNHQQTHSTQMNTPPTSTFSFRSAHQYPSNHDREANMDTTETQDSNSPPLRVEIVPRVPRSRPNRANRNHGNRSTLGQGAGAKRKIHFGDFFDLSGVNFDGGRDSPERGGGGGKRGRLV